MNAVTMTLPTLDDIAERLTKLADFYREHRPSLRTMRVYRADLARLKATHATQCRKYGFNRLRNGKYEFLGYLLIPHVED
jgi:hypothetical protein